MLNAGIEGANRDFASLSLKDLLAARDQYHFHLMNKANVVGTAVGRYLIRRDDPWPDGKHATLTKEGESVAQHKQPRTFENSEVRDYSWPCVIVLVKDWIESVGKNTGELHPEDFVPKTLYMPDGRMVPVCVVLVKQVARPRALPTWLWPSTTLCPGMPVVIDHQQQQRVATIGCLVTDGHTVYAVTNRHVSGSPGEVVYTWRRGERVRIGRTSDKQATRLPFSEIYPDYPGRRTYLNMDVGLVELDDLNEWTSELFDLGKVGELVDLHEANLGLNVIEAEVRAHGASSGQLDGRIKGLFYRYKAVGGYDYVADFLIAPDGPVSTHEGDSGTVWHLNRRGELLPIGLEWGAQSLANSAGDRYSFALATSLSNVCKHLDVEFYKDGVGAGPTWGQLGHYAIGAFASSALANGKLKQLMDANQELVSFKDDGLTPKNIKSSVKQPGGDATFIPLADVPDLVWKKTPKQMTGGRDRPAGVRSTGPEHPTHYADIDEPNPARNGQTLRQLCIDDPTKVDVAVWQAFYDECGKTEPSERGLLPFRVWQFYDAMVAALKAHDLDAFVCSAGLLSHYVGDACQPLHGSMFADGYADQPTTVVVNHRNGESEDVDSHVGAGVHSAYETAMIDRKSDEIVVGIPTAIAKLKAAGHAIGAIGDGRAAAVETVRLMARTAKLLPPRDIVDAFIEAGGKKVVAVYDALWEQFGDDTITTMADGATVLAAVWQAAWDAANADAWATQLGARDPDALQALYEKKTFVESLDLDHIQAVLK